MSGFSLGANGGSLQQLGDWTASGGALNAILVDGSDATAVTKSSLGGSNEFIVLGCADLSLPANEVISTVAPFIRWYGSGGSSLMAYWINEWYTGTTSYVGPQNLASGPSSSITNLTGAASAAKPSGGAWTSAALNACAIQLNDWADGVFNPALVYEASLVVATVSVPAAPTVSGPTGTPAYNLPVSWTHNDRVAFTITNKVLTSNVATLTTSVTHSLLVGNDVVVSGVDATFNGFYKITAVTGTTFSYSKVAANVGTVASGGQVTFGSQQAQSAYQVAVFSAAQYGIGGFDPAVSPSTFTTGQVTASTTSVTPSGLASGTAYRAYVRTATATAGGTLIWGAWAFSSFTPTFAVPATPTLSSSWDATNQRVILTFAGTSSILYEDDGDLENSLGTWAALTNCTVSQSATFASRGSNSLRLSSSAAGTMNALAPGSSALYRPVLPSLPYSATADFRSSIARTCVVKIRWYTAALAFISDSSGSTATSTTTGFTTYTVAAATSPANAAFASVVVEVQATAGAAELHYVDKIALHPGSTPAWSPGGAGGLVPLITRTDGSTITSIRNTGAFGVGNLDTYQRGTFYDYECRRGVPLTYTASLMGYFLASSTTSTSATTTSNVSSVTDGTWWLKAVAAPALNKGGARILTSPAESREENLGLFRADGRSDPIVVAGQTFGDDLTFRVYTSTAAEFEAVKALLVYQGTLLWQEPFTDSSGVPLQRYVRVTDRSWSKDGVPGSPRRVFDVKAVEVGKGY